MLPTCCRYHLQNVQLMELISLRLSVVTFKQPFLMTTVFLPVLATHVSSDSSSEFGSDALLGSSNEFVSPVG